MSICVRHLPYCRCCKSWFSVAFSICPIVDAASHYFLLHFPRSRRKLRSWGWGLPRPGLSWLGAPGYSDCWGYLDWGSQTRGTQTGGTQTKETHTRVCPDQGYPDQGYPDGGTLMEGTQMGVPRGGVIVKALTHDLNSSYIWISIIGAHGLKPSL